MPSTVRSVTLIFFTIFYLSRIAIIDSVVWETTIKTQYGDGIEIIISRTGKIISISGMRQRSRGISISTIGISVYRAGTGK